MVLQLIGALDAPAMAARMGEAAAKIGLPTLYVRGAVSEIVSRDDATVFVARLPDSSTDAMVARTIIGMGRGLGMEVIAEGIRPGGALPESLVAVRGRGVPVVPHGISLSLGGAETGGGTQGMGVTVTGPAGRSCGVGSVVPGSEAAAEP